MLFKKKKKRRGEAWRAAESLNALCEGLGVGGDLGNHTPPGLWGKMQIPQRFSKEFLSASIAPQVPGSISRKLLGQPFI